nr:hypothetical protein [Streptomyces viridosporus]
MNNGLRITAFAAALAATFGTAYGIGRGFDPVVADRAPAHEEPHVPSPSATAGDGGRAEHGTPPSAGSGSPRTATPSN